MYVMGLLTRIGLDGIFSGRKRKKKSVTCVKCIYYIEDKSILGDPRCKMNRKTRFTTNQKYFGFCSDKNWNGKCKDYKSTERNNGQKNYAQKYREGE